MKQQLVGEVQTFQSLLKERQMKIKSTRDRKKMFGRTTLSPFQKSLNRRQSSQVISSNEKTSFLAQTPDNVEGDLTNSFEDIELNLQPSQQILQQTDTSYLNSRVEAVTSIEKHIQELGTIFSRFSELVAQSETTVTRIDDNLAFAEDRMTLGQNELLKYWNSQSGNFWLVAKISFVLLFFLTVFIVFVL